jgi:hypothetical protein
MENLPSSKLKPPQQIQPLPFTDMWKETLSITLAEQSAE